MQLSDKMTVNQLEELLRHYRICACRVELFRGITYLKNKKITNELNFISIINNSVDAIRKTHKYGEKFYWILYFTYLSPQEPFSVNEVIEKMRTTSDSLKISRTTYFELRNKAIRELLATISGFEENTQVH